MTPQMALMESLDITVPSSGFSKLNNVSASALFFPVRYVMSKSYAANYDNHLCPVESKFGVVNTYVSGLLYVTTRKGCP